MQAPARNKRWVALVDGNPSQLALIKRAAKQHNVELTIVLDLMHVLEYVWKAGFALHGEGDTKTERWVSERLLEILRAPARLPQGSGEARPCEGRRGKPVSPSTIVPTTCSSTGANCATTSTSPRAAHRGDRRRLPPPGQGPYGNHWRLLGPGRRRGHPQASLAALQRRLRRLLDLPRDPGSPARWLTPHADLAGSRGLEQDCVPTPIP